MPLSSLLLGPKNMIVTAHMIPSHADTWQHDNFLTFDSGDVVFRPSSKNLSTCSFKGGLCCCLSAEVLNQGPVSHYGVGTTGLFIFTFQSLSQRKFIWLFSAAAFETLLCLTRLPLFLQ